MQYSLEDMQRSVLISQGGPCRVNKNSGAGGRNDEPENRNALGASSWRRLLGERGAAQNPAREMKVAEPVNVEFLQAERLQDLFVLHRCVPSIRSECQSGHNYRMSYRSLFLRLVVESLLRMQRKINRWNITGAPASGTIRDRPGASRARKARACGIYDCIRRARAWCDLLMLAAHVLPVVAIFVVAHFHLPPIA